MNIHEYQAKQLFQQYGIPVARGVAVQSAEAMDAALETFADTTLVVKAQIHAGGRGKGTFVDGDKGGVKVLPNKKEAKAAGLRMLGNTLITKQTGPNGRKVQTVYFTEPCAIAREFYLAILLDRASSKPVIIASTEGGVDIEEVAARQPEKILRVPVPPALGLQPFHARQVAYGLGLEGEQAQQCIQLVTALYQMWYEKDCSIVEINPLVIDRSGHISALDAKVSFDDNALFRHPEIAALRDLNEEDPKETQANKFGLSYIALDGDIACLVNGAGLAMATMDIIKHFGGRPANFLDVGGGANKEQVTEAFRIILSDPQVKGILVNIFGGIMSCQTIAAGIIAAARDVQISVPLVVRLEGNQVHEGKQMLAQSGLALTPAEDLSDAARKIVSLVAARG